MAVLAKSRLRGDLGSAGIRGRAPPTQMRINIDFGGRRLSGHVRKRRVGHRHSASTGMSPKALDEKLYFAKDLTDSSVLADHQCMGSDPYGPYQAKQSRLHAPPPSFGECEEDPTSPSLVVERALPKAGRRERPASSSLRNPRIARAGHAFRETLFSSTGTPDRRVRLSYGGRDRQENGCRETRLTGDQLPRFEPVTWSQGRRIILLQHREHEEGA